MSIKVPERVAANCRKTPEGTAWLAQLPASLASIERRWSLTLGLPFDSEEVSCAWVAPVVRADGSPAVLKLGMPHLEGADEIPGLRFWDGDPTIRLLDADETMGAMLLERCQPGTHLRAVPEPEQDLVIAGLLRRLWRVPPTPHAFRPLSLLTKYWSVEPIRKRAQWPDEGLVREGLRLFEELPRTAPTEVLLATDLHAGNVLRAARQPWFAIDPKPFVGDPAYDVTQHLFNCEKRLRSDPRELIARMADLVGIDAKRIRLWTFARAVAGGEKENWQDERWLAFARSLAP